MKKFSEHSTFNIQRPTLNSRPNESRWKLNVECWTLNVSTCIFALLLFLLLLASGCRTRHLFPPADLDSPGWRVQQGQAIWKPTRTRPALAGELLLATHTNGDSLIQFDKLPFPLVSARVSGDRWQIRFGSDISAWHGRGNPSQRFVWFQLPRALAGEPLNGHWQFLPHDDGSWQFNNSRTGESLEGSLTP